MIESPQKADRKQKEKARNPHDSWLFWQGQKDSNPRHAVLEVDVEKASVDIQQPIFRIVEPFVFSNPTPQKILMLY